MKHFFSILFVFFINTAYSQDIKVFEYKGTYTESNESRFSGDVVYSYYENSDYERILHGKFLFTSGKSYIASGKFNHNKRVGSWKFIRKTNFLDNEGIIVEEVHVNYDEDGNLNGAARYRKFNEKTKIEIEKSTAFFKNNIIIGDYYFKSKDFTIELHLDDEGFTHNTCKVTYEQDFVKYEDISKWNKGLLTWRLNRSVSHGEIFVKYDGETKYPDQYYEMKEARYFWRLKTAIAFWSTENLPYNNNGLSIADNPMYALIKHTPKVTFSPFNLFKNNDQQK
jgi:hypothetical protein